MTLQEEFQYEELERAYLLVKKFKFRKQFAEFRRLESKLPAIIDLAPRFLSRVEAAKRFGISQSKFDQDRKAGKIKLRPIPDTGRRVLFDSSQVDDEIERFKKKRHRK